MRSERPGPAVGDPRAGERHLAALLARRFGATDPVVARLARLTVRAAAAGHSCLDLALLDDALVASLDARRLARDAVGARAPAAEEDGPLPDLEAALAALHASPAVRVVGAPAKDAAAGIAVVEPRPLVLEGTRLATQREHAAEQRLVAGLTRRARAGRAPVVLPPTPLTDDPDQVAAVGALADAGVRAGIGVLAGGPGTGKTTTVAALLAARVAAAEARAAAGAPLRIALAAPTGKAAARLTESLRAALPRIAEAHGADVAAQLAVLEATTVHRLLGIGRDGTRRDDAPLPHDLVVVDEASMLALPLATLLVGALEDRTQLVLVGDPDQLESVETGSVLRALVDTLPAGGGPLARLTRNHRLDAVDPAAQELARAVRAGDADRAVALLRAAGSDGGTGEAPASLRFVATAEPLRHLDEVIAPLLDDGEGGGLLAALATAGLGDGAAALRALGAARLLCAHRHGPHGAATWAERVRARVAAHVGSGGMAPGEVWLPGEPVMALANDERTGLVNGDTGVVVGRGGSRRLVFERRDGTLLERPAEALPDVMSAYAVTVHKSQGSEFGTVVVVLPPSTSPLATRELLYTAITRARRRVVIVGDEAAVRAAVERPSLRMGGLADGLAQALAGAVPGVAPGVASGSGRGVRPPSGASG